MLWTAIGIGGIWVAVVLISLLSPDMVSGSEQEHLKVAAFGTWFWGGVGTLVFLWAMGRLRGDAMWRPTWIGLSIVTLGVWALATVLAIVLPVVETGSDPTQLPRWARSLRRWPPRCSQRSPVPSRACSAVVTLADRGRRN